MIISSTVEDYTMNKIGFKSGKNFPECPLGVFPLSVKSTKIFLILILTTVSNLLCVLASKSKQVDDFC